MSYLNKKNIYPQLSNNIVTDENKIFNFWEKESTFEKSLENKKKTFVFYDGPPFGNGLPHYGHIATGLIKDIIPRYFTMKGFHVRRVFGWDCHGLPAEMHVESEIKIHGKKQIEDTIGKKKFNDLCRTSVIKYADEWEKYVKRQARWVDFKNSYKTMDLDYMESVVWAFKTLYEKGLCYEATRIMPYSWKCHTALSNFETRMDGAYREKVDTSITVRFELYDIHNQTLKTILSKLDNKENYKIYALAWTSTPWTLPSNLGLAINSEIEYTLLKKDSNICIVAKDLASSYKHELGEEKIGSIKGASLVNAKYHPLFNYFIETPNAFRVLAGDNFVTSESGTGIVHMAPGFGEEDHNLCLKHNIKVVCPIDAGGVFTNEVKDYAGKQVFDTITDIVKQLKTEKKVVKIEQYKHNYPFCWRTDTPIIYRAVPSWYVNVVKIKEKIIARAKEINWMNDEVKNGMIAWLENARDWSISRNRLWGTPLLIWQSDDPQYPHMEIFGSVKELEAAFGVKITDMHTDSIDQLTKPNPSDPSGKSKLKRIDHVFDCWFESGCMPFAQLHYPFKNKEWFETNFPADFITEYVGQTRGWFYTLLVLGVALFDKAPFKNCLPHGIILDENAKKLSKRLRNYPDPYEIFETLGSDVMRATILSSPLTLGGNLCIDEKGKIFQESMRNMIAPLRNTYSFFIMYANTYNIKCTLISQAQDTMNLYILSKLRAAINNLDQKLSQYKIYECYQTIIDFVEIMNNWYIRRSRNIFRFMPSLSTLLSSVNSNAGFNDNDNANLNMNTNSNIDANTLNDQINKINLKDETIQEYFNTLFTCLSLFSTAIAPLLPLLSENIYKNLSSVLNDIDQKILSKFGLDKNLNSVHLQQFPITAALESHKDLEYKMDQYIDICTAVRMLRNENSCPIRRPLKEMYIISDNSIQGNKQSNIFNDKLLHEIVVDELNIKKVKHNTDMSKYADKKLNLNFKKIAARIPKNMKDILRNKHKYVVKDNVLIIADNTIFTDEFTLGWALKKEYSDIAKIVDNKIILLNFDDNAELTNESLIRDIIRSIQVLRGEVNLIVSDVANIGIIADVNTISVFKQYAPIINKYTNSKVNIIEKESEKSAFNIVKEYELGYKLLINKIEK